METTRIDRELNPEKASLPRDSNNRKLAGKKSINKRKEREQNITKEVKKMLKREGLELKTLNR